MHSAAILVPANRDAAAFLSGDDALPAAPLRVRALPANAPHGYTPQVGDCPSNVPSVRDASSLSPNETAWLSVRRNATVAPMRDLLGRMNITGFDAKGYIDAHKNNASESASRVFFKI